MNSSPGSKDKKIRIRICFRKNLSVRGESNRLGQFFKYGFGARFSSHSWISATLDQSAIISGDMCNKHLRINSLLNCQQAIKEFAHSTNSNTA